MKHVNHTNSVDPCSAGDSMRLDHVVLWVRDAREALGFYVDVLGLAPVRREDYERGQAPFPSVRISRGTILDLMEDDASALVEGLTGAAGGGRLNHLCLSLSAARYAALRERLARHGVPLSAPAAGSFGARGAASAAAYLRDPSGNVIEIRHYGASPRPAGVGGCRS